MMNKALRSRPEPLPLPPTTADMLAQKKNKLETSVNDLVDQIHVVLYDTDALYRQYLDAVWPESSVEGWLVLDDAKAAEKIKQYAAKNSMPQVSGLNTAAVIRHARVVWRRYQIDRKTRKNLVKGERVPNNGNGHDEE